MRPVRRLFRLGLGRPSLRESVDWEIEHHLAEQADRLMEQGMSAEEARHEAERRFGDLARERNRMMAVDRRRVVMRKRGESWDAVLAGVRQALRGVRRAPGLAAAVVLTLGLGIGVNAAMFGIVDRVLLRAPDHVVDPDRVRRVFRDGDFFGQPAVIPAATYPDVRDLRTIPEFASVGARTGNNPITLGNGADARQVMVTRATHDFFTTLGVQARLGRFFGPEDDELESPLTAVVSYEFWRSSMGSDPNVLGSTLELAGRDATVIGVAPKGFTGMDLEPVDVWLPAVPFQVIQTGGDRFFNSRAHWWLQAVVRLADGASVEAAEAKATALDINGREEPFRDPNVRILTTPLIQANGPSASNESKVARWLAGVSLIVLLIACANVANLLLAEGSRRRREVAVRLTLGVTRSRLLREMILEALVLATLGGVVALALAHWAGGLIRSVLIPNVLWTTSAVDGRVVAVTAALSLAAGLLAGFGPALQSTRVNLSRDLAQGGRGSSRGHSRTRGVLTVAQATLSTVLLVGAGLFIRSVAEVRRADLGMDVDRVVQATLEFQGGRPDVAEATRLYAEAMEAARKLPGVAGVAGTNILFQWARVEDLSVPGRDSVPVPPGSGPFLYGVTPGYLETMGVQLLRGRSLLDTDVEGAARVAVVNETMAAAFWPGQDPLGQCLYVGDTEECTTVVGVAEVASGGELEHGPLMAYHLPLAQMQEAPGGMMVRTEGDARALAAELAPVLRSFSPRVRFASVQPMRELFDPQARAWKLGATLFSAFGVLALLVAAIGLYSVLSFDVAQRTKEIGIRNALGARKSRVLGDVVTKGLGLAILGVILGLGASLAAGRYVQDLLFRVESADPLVLASVGGVLVLVAVVASLMPGLRAARVNPLDALRME